MDEGAPATDRELRAIGRAGPCRSGAIDLLVATNATSEPMPPESVASASLAARCENGRVGSKMPVPAWMQGWPVPAPVGHALLLCACYSGVRG